MKFLTRTILCRVPEHGGKDESITVLMRMNDEKDHGGKSKYFETRKSAVYCAFKVSQGSLLTSFQVKVLNIKALK